LRLVQGWIDLRAGHLGKVRVTCDE
jgi:hypothetical protein